MKKLASDAGIFFTRAVQVRPGAMPLAGPGCGARPSTLQQDPLPCCCGGACWDSSGPCSPVPELPRGAPSGVSCSSLMARGWGLGCWAPSSAGLH